jgi:DNA polymerase
VTPTGVFLIVVERRWRTMPRRVLDAPARTTLHPRRPAMNTLLRELRRVFEREQALYGRLLPLPPEEPRNPKPETQNPSENMPNQDLFGNEVDPAEDASRPPPERIASLIDDDHPAKNMQTIEEVRDWMDDEILVPLDEERQNVVFGTGDPDADLVIIGEAPGADEDKHGEPFVGRAGQLLDKILDAIHFAREDVYITNILKSRPPRNRDPLKAEVEAHLPVLYKQLALIAPKLILCVGKVAGNTLLDRRSSLKNLRDKFHDFYGLPLMVTYHPAALLRNANWKRPTWEDVKLLRTRYDELGGK